MKFIIHFVANAMAQVWLAAFPGSAKADQHHDPVTAVSRGPLLSILTSTY